MTLGDYLKLLTDEEVRIELEIDEPYEDDYVYYHFWLSDYRTSLDTAKYYVDYVVTGTSFEPRIEDSAQVVIEIEKTIKKFDL